ncbi:MAG TPA: hypothetical protein VKA91_01250 [Nitrososphaeraceae archaeon]|nr:hypothetical protein [Nitrososphaeraceae archaeon]
MKKEFIVSKIENPQDGSAYVYVVLTDTRANFTSTRRQQGFPENPFGVAAIPITSLDDLKNLPKKISDAIEGAFSGGGGRNNMSSESTTFKMTTSEFEELGIKIGDKITLEIEISDSDISA